jgi:hypothetical protein
MTTPRPTNAVRRLESARSAFEFTASMIAASVQLVTFAAVVRRTLRGVGKKSTRAT